MKWSARMVSHSLVDRYAARGLPVLRCAASIHLCADTHSPCSPRLVFTADYKYVVALECTPVSLQSISHASTVIPLSAVIIVNL